MICPLPPSYNLPIRLGAAGGGTMNAEVIDQGASAPPAISTATRRAVTEYGPTLTDPKYSVFARMLSEGKTQIESYDACFPHSAKSTLGNRRNQASIIAAHPDMPGLIDGFALGGQNLLSALVPTCIRTLGEIVAGEVKDGAKVRLDAIKTTLSRTGHHESKELAVTGTMLVASMHARLAPLVGSVAPEISQSSDTREALELDREEWKALEPAG